VNTDGGRNWRPLTGFDISDVAQRNGGGGGWNWLNIMTNGGDEPWSFITENIVFLVGYFSTLSVSRDQRFSNFFVSRRTVKHIQIFWHTSCTKLKIY
jgi:hypothetical protein